MSKVNIFHPSGSDLIGLQFEEQPSEVVAGLLELWSFTFDTKDQSFWSTTNHRKKAFAEQLKEMVEGGLTADHITIKLQPSFEPLEPNIDHNNFSFVTIFTEEENGKQQGHNYIVFEPKRIIAEQLASDFGKETYAESFVYAQVSPKKQKTKARKAFKSGRIIGLETEQEPEREEPKEKTGKKFKDIRDTMSLDEFIDYGRIGFDKLAGYKSTAVTKAKKVIQEAINLGYAIPHDFGRGKGKFTTTKKAEDLSFESIFVNVYNNVHIDDLVQAQEKEEPKEKTEEKISQGEYTKESTEDRYEVIPIPFSQEHNIEAEIELVKNDNDRYILVIREKFGGNNLADHRINKDRPTFTFRKEALKAGLEIISAGLWLYYIDTDENIDKDSHDQNLTKAFKEFEDFVKDQGITLSENLLEKKAGFEGKLAKKKGDSETDCQETITRTLTDEDGVYTKESAGANYEEMVFPFTEEANVFATVKLVKDECEAYKYAITVGKHYNSDHRYTRNIHQGFLPYNTKIEAEKAAFLDIAKILWNYYLGYDGKVGKERNQEYLIQAFKDFDTFIAFSGIKDFPSLMKTKRSYDLSQKENANENDRWYDNEGIYIKERVPELLWFELKDFSPNSPFGLSIFIVNATAYRYTWGFRYREYIKDEKDKWKILLEYEELPSNISTNIVSTFIRALKDALNELENKLLEKYEVEPSNVYADPHKQYSNLNKAFTKLEEIYKTYRLYVPPSLTKMIHNTATKEEAKKSDQWANEKKIYTKQFTAKDNWFELDNIWPKSPFGLTLWVVTKDDDDGNFTWGVRYRELVQKSPIAWAVDFEWESLPSSEPQKSFKSFKAALMTALHALSRSLIHNYHLEGTQYTKPYNEVLNIQIALTKLRAIYEEYNIPMLQGAQDILSSDQPKEEGHIDRVVAHMHLQYAEGKRLTKGQIEKLQEELKVPNLGQLWEAVELSWFLWYRNLYREPYTFDLRLKMMFDFWRNIQPTYAYSDSSKELYKQYSTPCIIGAIIAEYTEMETAKNIFEPSAGNGLLLVGAELSKVYANEIDKTRGESLKFLQIGTITHENAAKPFPKELEKSFDVVVTNPPFAKWEENKIVKGVYVQKYFNNQLGVAANIRLEHFMAGLALRMMKDDGKAAIIIMGHIRFDEDGFIARYRPFFNWLFRHYIVDDVINMNGFKLYNKQGATIETMLILIGGRKKEPHGAAPKKQDRPKLDQMIDNYYDLWDRVKESKGYTLDKILRQLQIIQRA